MVLQDTVSFLSMMLKRESGLVIDDSKTYLVDARLEPLAQEEGYSSIDDLTNYLRINSNPMLLQKVIDAMTTNETLFFRDHRPFDLLRKILIPDLLKINKTSRKIRIWSAACSTGQEPYSIAIVLLELGSIVSEWDIQIIATDISRRVLESARDGIFSQNEVQRGLPVSYLTRYFQQIGTKWELRSNVKQIVQFRQLNLLDHFSALGSFDLIFCRNVLIYFDVEMKQNILDRMKDTLHPDGGVILGGSETILGVTEKLVRVTVDGHYYYKANQEIATKIK